MTFSGWVRLICIVCAALWIAMPSLFAQDVPGAFDRGQPAQPDSPLPTPPLSPIPTPYLDPAGCGTIIPCDGAATPDSSFQTFLPGVSDQPAANADNRPPGPPPDLGSVLNYVAAAVVAIGGTLRIYWFISDRRKRAAK